MAKSVGSGGVLIAADSVSNSLVVRDMFLARAQRLGLESCLYVCEEPNPCGVRVHLLDEFRERWAPAYNTLQLHDNFQRDNPATTLDLEREIILALLLGPVVFQYPSYAEFEAAIRIRKNIVGAAARTELSFHTSKIERPADYWRYSDDTGFTVQPGKPLIDALQKATQPEVSGEKYSFSCYRATEYVLLLGIAQELADSNPPLLEQLQKQWETRAIMSGRFHETFLYEYGAMNDPLPPKYYVPGDRLWFRNPDEHSSDASGYEGSWVLYLGHGLFTNFWQRDKPYDMTAKCLEIYHWRDATYLDEEGELRVDDAIVEQRVRSTLENPSEVARILDLMLRFRDPQGVYSQGGCIDTTREYPRFICPATVTLALEPLAELG